MLPLLFHRVCGIAVLAANGFLLFGSRQARALALIIDLHAGIKLAYFRTLSIDDEKFEVKYSQYIDLRKLRP